MPLQRSRLVSVLLVSLGALDASHAAQQCFAANGGTPTVYGAVTVTVTGCTTDNSITQGPFAPGEAQLYGGPVTSCTYAFSKPLLTSSVSVQVHLLRDVHRLTLATSAGTYQAVPADIGAPLAGSAATGSVQINGTQYTGTTSPYSSGTLTLTNSPPATTTSLTVAQSGAWPFWVKVCADDAGTPPAAVQPVPTLSQWSVLLTSGLLAAAAVLALSRTRRKGERRAP